MRVEAPKYPITIKLDTEWEVDTFKLLLKHIILTKAPLAEGVYDLADRLTNFPPLRGV